MTDMVKSELIEKIAHKMPHLPPKVAELGVNFLFEHLVSALSRGERVEIRDFGSFSLHYREARRAHNPRTGEKVATLGKYIPHFKPGKALRDRINKTCHIPIKDTSNEDG